MKVTPLGKVRRANAFTLVELIAVMAIIGILAALSVPAISSLRNSGSMNQAVTGISLLLDQARSYAMAHDTYVWVGFAPNTNSQQLMVGVVAGTSGSSGDLSSTSTYLPVTRVQSYDHLTLKNISGLTGMSSSGDGISESQLGTFQQSVGGATVAFTSVLQFNPQGEATLGLTGDGAHCIQIGLQPVQGGNVQEANVAVIQVADLTGQVQVFRP